MNSWRRHEDEILVNSRKYLGLSYGDIAKQLADRTRNAVRHRWEKLVEKGLDKEYENKSEGPKILVFDIETSPMIVYSWGVYQQYINPDNVIQDWFVISWAAKWLGKEEIFSAVVTPTEAKNSDDRRVVSEMWKLLDQADIVVAHNGDRFDRRKLNWRFLVHGFPPPLLYKSVDTLKIAKKHFAASSNKLDYLLKALSIGQKIDTNGFELWKDCVSGDKQALADMLKYNINDITTLEEIYYKLLPWIHNHPNTSLYVSDEHWICPACGSDNIEMSDKVITTAVNAYYQYRCLDCNHVGRTKEHATTMEKRKATLAN